MKPRPFLYFSFLLAGGGYGNVYLGLQHNNECIPIGFVNRNNVLYTRQSMQAYVLLDINYRL